MLLTFQLKVQFQSSHLVNVTCSFLFILYHWCKINGGKRWNVNAKRKWLYCHVDPFRAMQRLNGRNVYFIECATTENREENCHSGSMNPIVTATPTCRVKNIFTGWISFPSCLQEIIKVKKYSRVPDVTASPGPTTPKYLENGVIFRNASPKETRSVYSPPASFQYRYLSPSFILSLIFFLAI